MISLVRATSSLAQGSAVRSGRVPFGGRRVPDDGPHHDQGRTLSLGPGCGQRGVDRGQVVAVAQAEHVPPVGLEPASHILAEGEGGGPVDGDVVVVVDHRQLAEAEVAGQGRRLAGDALHQVAVAREHPGPVVDQLVARPVEPLREEPLRHGHPDGITEPLSQRAGRGLDAGRVPALGVSGRFRAPLPEGLQLLEREVVSGEVEQRVEQHRRVAAREDEPVAVGPAGL